MASDNEGFGTAPAAPANVSSYQTWALGARQQGYSDDEIQQAALTSIKQARDAGHSDADIQQAMGVNDPSTLHDLFRARAIPALNTFTAPGAQGVVEGAEAGLEGSSGGLRWRQELPEMTLPANAGFGTKLGYTAGSMLGSLADMATGFAIGAGAGAGAGLLTGPGEAVVIPSGAAIGSFMLPAMERQQYMEALIKGKTAGWQDFTERESAVVWEGIKAMLVGQATGGAGNAMSGLGGATFIDTLKKVSVETAAMTGSNAALAGQIPDWSDLGTGALMVGAMHVAGEPSRLSPAQLKTVAVNLGANWARTGEAPEAAAQRAQSDPLMYQWTVLPKPPEPPPQSSETTAGPDIFVIGKRTPETSAPVESDEFTTSTKAGPEGSWTLELTGKPTQFWSVSKQAFVHTDEFTQEDHNAYELHEALDFHDIPEVYDMPVQYAPGATTADIPGEPGQPRSELPPDKPTDFEKGQTYYNYVDMFAPLRWSESAQGWVNSYQLSEDDWAFQRQLHEPPVGKAGEDMTAWWHGSDHLQPALMPLGYGGNIKAIWMASDRATSEAFTGGPTGEFDPAAKRAPTITRVWVKPGKYFDFRDEAHIADFKEWVQHQETDEEGYLKNSSTASTGPVDAEGLVERVQRGHYTTMQKAVMQRYFQENGYDGYFEREHMHTGTPVNLALYNMEKRVIGETTRLDSQAARIGRYEGGFSPHEPEDMDRPGTMLAAYMHGDMVPGTIGWLGERPTAGAGGGGEGGEPPSGQPPEGEEPPPALPPTEDEAWRLTAAEIGTRVQPGWFSRLKTGMRDAYRQFMNIGHPVRQLLEQAIATGRALPEAKQADFLTRLASGATSDTISTNRIVNELLPVWRPFMKETGDKNFWTYMTARTRLADAFIPRENPPDAAQIDRWAMVKAAGDEKYGTAFDATLKFYNSTLKDLVGNRISQAQYDGMVGLGDAGLPLMRLEEEGAPEHAARPEGAAKPKTTVFTREGSDLKVLQQGYSIISRTLARRRTLDMDARNLAVAEAAEKLGHAIRVKSDAVVWTPEELREIGMDQGNGDEGKLLGAVARKLGWEMKGDTVITFKDGQATQWKFDDPGFARLMNGLDVPSTNLLVRAMTPLTNFTRSMMSVANPLFAPHIMAGYDMLFQHVVNPEGRNSFVTMMSGVRTLFNAKDYDAAVSAGAIDHVFKSLADDKYVAKVLQGKEDPAYTSGVWNRLTSPIDSLKAWSSAWFHVMPLGRFTLGRQAGESETEAAAMATNTQFDPAGGGGPAGRLINLTSQPFFKAYLTNLERTGRAMLGIGRDLGGTKFDGLDFARKAIPFVTVPFISSYLHNRDKDWYINAPDWQKNNGLLLHTGGDEPGQGTTFYFAYPPLIGLMFGGIPRMMVERIGRDNPHAFDHLGTDLVGALAPPAGAMFGGNLLMPVLEKLAGHSFFRNAPLNPDIKALPQEQFTPYSSWAAKKLSAGLAKVPFLRNMAWTPPEIDNMAQDYTGSAGRFLLAAAEKAAAFTGVIPDKMPAGSIFDWPGFASYVSRNPSPAAQPIQDFNHRMGVNAMIQGSMRETLAQGDPERFRELTNENPAAALTAGLKGQINGDPAEFLSSLEQAAQTAGANAEPITQVLMADQKLKLLRQAAGYIGNLPNKTDLSLTQQQTLMGYQRAVATIQPGVTPMDLATISPADKKQLLDTVYTAMSIQARAGIAAMDKAKMQ